MVQFGVHVGQQQCSMAELREAWAAAERLGFDWVSVWDHFYPSTLPLTDPCFEGIACHAALAAVTTRVRVGSLVYSAGYRHPALLANAAATIDHLSDGRLELGIGAGWHEAEYRAHGIPFEPPATRLRRMRETVEIVRALWRGEPVDYDGEFYQLTEAICAPVPLQESPRIWVGASGEKLGLRMAGELADGWNLVFPSPEDFRRKLETVRSHSPRPDRLSVGVNLGFLPCPDDHLDDELTARFGPGAALVRPATLAGSAERMIDHVAEYVSSGADWVVLALRAPFDLEGLSMFAEQVAPHFAKPLVGR